MARAFEILVYSCMVAILLGAGFVMLGLKGEIPGGYEIKIVRSGSMEPTIMTGGLIVLRPEATYRSGDIITFGRDTKSEIPTTHRIVEEVNLEAGSAFWTQGDANEDRDNAPVYRGDVIGKVVFSMPYAGFIIDFARQPIGFALLVGVPAALIIIQELLTILGEVRTRYRTKHDDAFSPEPSRTYPAFTELPVEERPKTRMDDMVRRAVVQQAVPLPPHAHAVPQATRSARHDIRSRGLKRAVLASAVLCVLITQSAHIGSTLSYFNDTEWSLGNILAATNLDGLLEGMALTGLVCEDTPPIVTNHQLENRGTLPFDYELTVELSTSSPTDLCGVLHIVAKNDGMTEYDGPLTGLSLSAISLEAGGVDTWTFEASVATGTPSADIAGSCVFDTVFRAKQEQFGFGEAFNDDERKTHVIDGDASQCEEPPEEQVCHFLPNTICLDVRKVIREGFVPTDFQFHIVGTSTGINAVLNHEDSIDLPVGYYTIQELFPPAFDPSEWKTKWDGHCLDSDFDDMQGYVDIAEHDLDEIYWHCSVSNIWDGEGWIDPHDGREEDRHDRTEYEYGRAAYDDAIRDAADREERAHRDEDEEEEYDDHEYEQPALYTASEPEHMEGEVVGATSEGSRSDASQEAEPQPEPAPEPESEPEPEASPEPPPAPVE